MNDDKQRKIIPARTRQTARIVLFPMTETIRCFHTGFPSGRSPISSNCLNRAGTIPHPVAFFHHKFCKSKIAGRRVIYSNSEFKIAVKI
jgi:hypothetical protein